MYAKKFLASRAEQCLTLPRIKCANGEGLDGVEIGFPKFKLLCRVVCGRLFKCLKKILKLLNHPEVFRG